MTAIGTLGLTTDDVAADLNPLSESGLLSIGSDSGQIAAALVEQRIAEVDEWVLSMLPERYRRMARQVEGEMAVKWATAGQTQFTLSLSPVTAGTLSLFLDWQSPEWSDPATAEAGGGVRPWYSFGSSPVKPYSRRTPADAIAASDYTLTTATGVVTMASALAEGSNITADYEHTGFAGCHFLRRLALDLIGARLTKSLPDVTVDAWNNADKQEATAKAVLLQIADGSVGIDLLDRINLLPDYETRASSRAGRKLPMLGGW